MNRALTWAELLLILTLGPIGVVSLQHLYGFVTDRISIEVRVK